MHSASTVLVIEDEPLVQAVFVGIVERNGFLVLSACTGEAAFQLAADLSIPIDLVISDIVFPGASGTDVVLRIRSLRPDLPVLFTSGTPFGWLPTPDRANIAKLAKAPYSFLQKPFTARQLMFAVRELLASHVTLDMQS